MTGLAVVGMGNGDGTSSRAEEEVRQGFQFDTNNRNKNKSNNNNDNKNNNKQKIVGRDGKTKEELVGNDVDERSVDHELVETVAVNNETGVEEDELIDEKSVKNVEHKEDGYGSGENGEHGVKSRETTSKEKPISRAPRHVVDRPRTVATPTSPAPGYPYPGGGNYYETWVAPLAAAARQPAYPFPVDPPSPPGADVEIRRNRGGVQEAFPQKLHRMLDFCEREGLSDVVSFFTHGRAFAIHKPRRFVTVVMSRFFKQTKLTSFQRQLNLYGFRRLTQGPDNGGYWHPYFLKGRPTLCVNMTRIKFKEEQKSERDPDHEPNFYAMPPVRVENGSYRSPQGGPPASKESQDRRMTVPLGYPYGYPYPPPGAPYPYGYHPSMPMAPGYPQMGYGYPPPPAAYGYPPYGHGYPNPYMLQQPHPMASSSSAIPKESEGEENQARYGDAVEQI